MTEYIPCVCLDFDGVIHAYERWTGKADIPNPPVKGIEGFMRELKELGYDIAVCSSRASEESGRIAIIQWMKKYDLYKYVWCVSDVKPPAVAYVDDRGVRFEGDFGAALESIKDLRNNGNWIKRGKQAQPLITSSPYRDLLKML